MDKGIKANKSEDLVCMMPSTTTVYSVRRVQQECDCKLCCGLCEACVHMCTCTCIDSAVDSTVCKHVHIVHMTELSERTQFPSTRHSLQSPFIEIDTINVRLQSQTAQQAPSSVAKLKQYFSLLVTNNNRRYLRCCYSESRCFPCYKF